MSERTLDPRPGRPPGGSLRDSVDLSFLDETTRSRWVPVGALLLAFVACGLVASSFTLPATALSHARDALAARQAELQGAKSAVALREIQLQRLQEIQRFSAEYAVPSDMAADVYDIALAEGLDPELAFRLVETESSFRRRAVSEAGAVGYTQIKPSTANLLVPSLEYEELFDRRTNLRLGFRYLSLLLERYDDDMRLALLAYNRGPTRVGSLIALGRDPANGYASRVLHGYVGFGAEESLE